MGEQSVKINLSANAVRSLLGDNPEAMVELTRKASCNVADALARRWEQGRVEDTVNRIEHEMNVRLSRYVTLPTIVQEKLMGELRLIIGREVNTAVTSLVNQAITGYVQQTIDKQVPHVVSLVEQKALALVEKKVEERINALLKLSSNLGRP